MNQTRTIVVAVGTRPEIIKLAPVIKELGREPRFSTHVLFTSQHRDMLRQIAQDFAITPDHDLDLMVHNQGITDFLSRCMSSACSLLESLKPDLVLVQGDTSTVLGVGLACAFNRISLGHVEAGLRTNKKYLPFPEEMNRHLVSVVTDFHFCPTSLAAENLRRENVPDWSIHVTGNTVVDAMLQIKNRALDTALEPGLQAFVDEHPKFVLITAHRRENFGAPLLSICESVRELAEQHPESGFIYPVHQNPNVKTVVMEKLHGVPNIHLCAPLSYFQFIKLLQACHVILTDSGGVQEEAPTFGKPVVLMREETERPEGVEAGVTFMTGTDRSRIVSTVNGFLGKAAESVRQSFDRNPYGDGRAAERIRRILTNHFFGAGK